MRDRSSIQRRRGRAIRGRPGGIVRAMWDPLVVAGLSGLGLLWPTLWRNSR